MTRNVKVGEEGEWVITGERGEPGGGGAVVIGGAILGADVALEGKGTAAAAAALPGEGEPRR